MKRIPAVARQRLNRVRISPESNLRKLEALSALEQAFADMHRFLAANHIATPIDLAIPHTLTFLTGAEMVRFGANRRAYSGVHSVTGSRDIFLNEANPTDRFVDVLNHEMWHLASVDGGFHDGPHVVLINECAIAYLTEVSSGMPADVAEKDRAEIALGRFMADIMGHRAFVSALFKGDYESLRSALVKALSTETVEALEACLGANDEPPDLNAAITLTESARKSKQGTDGG